MCGACLGRDVKPEATSGTGTVFSYTVNCQPWRPGLRIPYVIALVELAEQDGMRLNTNIVGCPPEDVRIGMPVRVTFEEDGEYFIPLFEPWLPDRSDQLA
jgi:uncharacterized OB-fold protein